MSDHVYGVSEVVGTSAESIDAAIRNAVERANRTVRHLDWFEVVGVRGHIAEGQVAHFQVTVKLGFRLDAAGGDPHPAESSAAL
ncbi:MAG TPA: dodecin [Propionibacteriaceae bacterium]|nr:dodecin [Propionibacteriaceae bacterium]